MAPSAAPTAGQVLDSTPAPAIAPKAAAAAPPPPPSKAVSDPGKATKAPVMLGHTCEEDLLKALVRQQAYHPDGYSTDAELSTPDMVDAWASLGCLTCLTNLTLRGSLPSLPDSWAAQGSFLAMQSLNLPSLTLAGSLPASWGNSGAFCELLVMDLSRTPLSGKLRTSSTSPQALGRLEELHLAATSITGGRQFFSCIHAMLAVASVF